MDQAEINRRRRAREERRWKRKMATSIFYMVTMICCVLTVTLVIAKMALSPSPAKPDQTLQQTEQTEETVPTEPTEDPQKIIHLEIENLFSKTDFVAAGYDYQKAISMLKASEYYGSSPEIAAKETEYLQMESQLVPYARPDTITHIFFHSLVVDPERAFDGDTDQDGYNMYMTTVDEFNAILESMYERGYVLISPYDMAYEVTDDTGTHFTYGQILLPPGKIPFLMSQDDLNYYSYMIGTGSGINDTPVFVDSSNDGFAHKLVIGEDGYPTCEYMDASGSITTGDYDLVPVLETFIQNHPDFSYRGARAILGMTGYEGVFGYRTKPSYETAMGSEAYAEEVAAAKEVAQCLRDKGWILASHSYGHPAYGNLTAERVEKDSGKWEDTVQPIIGDCDVILYPHGSDIAGIEKYTFDNGKFKVLYEDGYRYFFNVDGHQYWNQLGDNYFRGGRRNLDGYRIYHHPSKVQDLIDAKQILDKSRPLPVPKVGGGM